MKFRSGLLVGAAFIAGVAVGPATGLFGYARPWSIGQANAQDRGDTYRLLQLFGDVFDRIRAEYVEPVSDRELVENAINGMLTGLDPHSSYMNAKAFRDMQVQTRGEFGGLGLEVTQEGGIIKVVSPIDDTPAARAGIKAGDLITTIDNTTVQGLSLNEAVDKMRGTPNSTIRLVIKREGDRQADRGQPATRGDPHPGGQEPPRGRHRLYPADSVQRADRCRAARRGVQHHRQQLGDRLHGIVLDLRNNPGGLLDQAVIRVRRLHRAGGDRVHPRPPPRRVASAGTPSPATSPAACRSWC